MIDLDGRERDRLGRVVPHRLNPIALIRAIPGLASRFSTIPDQAYDPDSHTVSCTCGQSPQFEADQFFVACACGRYFLRAGKQALVANSPVITAADRGDPGP